MKKEFKVYKAGVTEEKVTIMSRGDNTFDRDAKIAKYFLLGYRVFEMDDTEITE